MRMREYRVSINDKGIIHVIDEYGQKEGTFYRDGSYKSGNLAIAPAGIRAMAEDSGFYGGYER